MLKKSIVLLLFVCLLLSAGCGNHQEMKEPNSTEETSSVPNAVENLVSAPAETSVTPDAEETGPISEPSGSESIPEPQANIPAEPKTPAQDKQTTSQTYSALPPTESSQTGDTETKPQPPDEAGPVLEQPVQTEPVVPPEMPVKPESTPEPEPIPEPEFDINYWVSFAKSYAESAGLTLDSEAVWCWDTPIVAGSHCLYLERDISNRLDRYSNDSDISMVWIWSESRGDGSYDLYIGYA